MNTPAQNRLISGIIVGILLAWTYNHFANPPQRPPDYGEPDQVGRYQWGQHPLWVLDTKTGRVYVADQIEGVYELGHQEEAKLINETVRKAVKNLK